MRRARYLENKLPGAGQRNLVLTWSNTELVAICHATQPGPNATRRLELNLTDTTSRWLADFE